MNYVEINFKIADNSDEKSEILMALLDELPFESFEQIETGLLAYMPEESFSSSQFSADVAAIVLPGIEFTYTEKVIPRENWNAEWEKNFFEPILIDDACLIRSSFHQNTPKVPYEIIIDPKMSFGTGHHSTTTLMVKEILKMELQNKSLLDMGCGTGILAILAAMRGANPVMAIDIDEWAYENTAENTITNGTPDIQVKQGGAELLEGDQYEIILANINRNILLADMEAYVKCLPVGGNLIMSGFYQEDIPIIEEKAQSLNLQMKHYEVLNKWSCTSFERIK